jgi:hypothetical protein
LNDLLDDRHGKVLHQAGSFSAGVGVDGLAAGWVAQADLNTFIDGHHEVIQGIQNPFQPLLHPLKIQFGLFPVCNLFFQPGILLVDSVSLVQFQMGVDPCQKHPFVIPMPGQDVNGYSTSG